MTITQTAEEHWVRFRTSRDAALAQTHGWLTLTSLQWLALEPAHVQVIPGLWWVDAGSAHLSAEPGDGIIDLATGRILDGTITATLDDEESLMWVAHGGDDGRRIVVELANRAGRYAIRTRDALSPTVTGFTGVPVFGYRPDLVVEGRFEPFDEPVEEPVRTAHPEVPGAHRTVGEVMFTLPGHDKEFRLRATEEDAGSLGITFHDDTNGTTTPAWRRVTASRPRPDGTVIIDFNRTVGYPSAFTSYGTCPMPVSTNVVDAPIEAGEKDPLA